MTIQDPRQPVSPPVTGSPADPRHPIDDIGIIDLMIGFPKRDASDHYRFLAGAVKDAESKTMAMPAQYMFTGVPADVGDDTDTIAMLLDDMDRCGIARGMVHMGSPESIRALAEHPDRIIPCVDADPNDLPGSLRRIRTASDEWGIKAVTSFPAGLVPQVGVSDAGYYPIYAACVDLDIPIIINAGVPGPRVPMMCQHVEHFDQVCYDFPELRIVIRHGAEPWQELAVKLMLKWPGLYYMTSAFAPKHYPKEIVAYANSRGVNKIMYAGYYPMGLSLDRIVAELRNVAFRDHVWTRFLRDNAIEVFRL